MKNSGTSREYPEKRPMSKKRMMHVLPVEAYTSQEWFDREQALIFSKVWRYGGFVEDITEPGEYISVQAGLNNIFIVMGRDRRLRAFHNLCRHRGTQLLRAVGKTQKAITCPYHDWTYNLEGTLISVPNAETEFPDLDTSCLALHPASVDLWRGMLWVHPNPNAGSIMGWFGEVEPLLGPHQVDNLIEYPEASASTEIKANWKIVVENYIDVYHLSHLHANTLHMYDHAKAEFGFVGPHYAFWEPLAEWYAAEIEKNAPLPLLDEIPRDKLGAWVPMLFPGIGLAENESSWSTYVITPLAPDLTRVETRSKVKNVAKWKHGAQAWRSHGFWQKHVSAKYEGDAKTDPMATGDFMAEDVYVCEQQQKSLKSPYFAIGATAVSGENPVRTHQQIVLDFMEGRR